MKYYKLLDNITGERAIYTTKFKMNIKDDKLIVKFVATNCSMNSYSDKYNDPIYNGDVCELFLAVGKKDKYWEFEVAPNKTMFFAEITNAGGDIEVNKIEKNPAKLKSFRLFKTVYHTITFKLDDLQIKDIDDIEFNAFRIETDGVKPDKHLFALFPTCSGSFHKRRAFERY